MLVFYIYLVCTGLVASTSAQRPEEYCDVDIPVSEKNISLPTFVATENLAFQALYEINKQKDGLTEEIREIFDGKSQVAISLQTLLNIRVKTYSDYGRNELTAVFNYGTKDAQCKMLNLKENIELTPFEIKEIDGKEIAVSPISSIFHNTGYFKFKFVGDTNFVRGIPVNEWQTCNFNDGKSTSKITYSFSNPDKWVPSYPFTDYNSIPVQVLYENMDTVTKEITTVVYSISEFKPFIDAKEEVFTQPKGVYCPGKVNSKPVPAILNSFKYSLSIVTAETENAEIGFLSDSQEHYSYDLNLFRYQRVENNQQIDELHDFTTGLSYSRNHKTGKCMLKNLDSDSIDVNDNQSNDLRLKTPTEFFDLDGANVQYAGQRKVEGVNADVWIGTKQLKNKNLNTTFEWYFLSDKWNRPDFRSTVPVPIRVDRTDILPVPGGYEKSAITSYYHHFRYVPESIDYDMIINACNGTIRQKRYGFSIENTQTDLIRQFEPQFELAVLKTLSASAQVTFVRIGNIEVIFNEYSVYVMFTLRDKTGFYGNGKTPMQDADLEVAMNNLELSFKNETAFKIKLELPDDMKSVDIEVKANSFNQLSLDGRNIIHQNITALGYSQASVFFVVLFAVLNGLVIGLLFTELHKFNIISVPCFKRE